MELQVQAASSSFKTRRSFHPGTSSRATFRLHARRAVADGFTGNIVLS